MSTRQHHLLVLPLSYLLQLPPPSAIQGTIINAPPIGENDHLNENFVDNYSLDADDGGEYTLCQKMVHYCGGHIAVEHLAACKAVLVSKLVVPSANSLYDKGGQRSCDDGAIQCKYRRTGRDPKASSMADCLCKLLKFFRNLNRTFKMPKTPSMSFRTDSTFALHFITALPGTPAFTGEIKHGQRWYPPAQIK